MTTLPNQEIIIAEIVRRLPDLARDAANAEANLRGIFLTSAETNPAGRAKAAKGAKEGKNFFLRSFFAFFARHLLRNPTP